MPRRWFIEVDQSGRMEMSGDTVVAVANGFSVTVRITPDVKDAVRETLRRRGVRPRLIMIRMFVAAITLALHDHLAEIGGIVIDEEYIGYEAELKSLLLDRLRKLGCQREATDVTISRVGKKSPAHFAAICVTRRQAKADITPTPEALLELC